MNFRASTSIAPGQLVSADMINSAIRARGKNPSFIFNLDASDGWRIIDFKNPYFTAPTKHWDSKKILDYVRDGAVFCIDDNNTHCLEIKKYKKVEFCSNIKDPDIRLEHDVFGKDFLQRKLNKLIKPNSVFKS